MASGLCLLPGGSGSLDRAEVYFMDGARSMLERGDYLVPYYRDEPFFDKPVFTYWLMAGSFHLFGPTPEAARLAPAVAALGVLAVTLWLGTLLFDRRSALAAAWALATTVPFLSFARIAMSDLPMTFWSTLAVALAVAAYRPGASRAVVPAVGAVLGLGFLTKGPVAVLLPGLAILALLWQRRRNPATLAQLALAAVLFLAFGCGWFVAVYHRLGSTPLEYFFLRENLQRFAGDAYDAGRGPWFYFVTYLAQGAPWSLFLPAAAIRCLRRSGDGGREAIRWLLGALGLMVIPLSVSRGKLDYYLLPLYPLASLIVGRYFALAWERFEQRWARGVLFLGAAGLAASALTPLRFPSGWLPGSHERTWFFVATGLVVLALLLTMLRATAARTIGCLATASAFLFASLVYFWLPAFGAGQPNRTIVEDVAREHVHRPDARFVVCGDPTRAQREVIFHTAIATMDHCELWAPATSKLPFLLLVSEQEWQSLQAIPWLRLVGEYRYLPPNAWSLTRLIHPPELRTVYLAANFTTSDPVARRKARREHMQRRLLKGKPF